MKIERQITERWDMGASLAASGLEQKHLFRLQLGEEQNWRCCYCGVEMNRWRNVPTVLTIEHVIPDSAGGKRCWETCVAACKRCNNLDGIRLSTEGSVPLNLPLCPNCGSLDTQELPRGIVRCRVCRTQARRGYTSGLPFAAVPFAALRRVAGELIVSRSPANKIALTLRHRILTHLVFTPYTLADSLIKIAAPVVEAARAGSDDLVEIYNATISVLKDRYTLEAVRGPRGPLPETTEVIDDICHLSLPGFNAQSRKVAERQDTGAISHRRQ